MLKLRIVLALGISMSAPAALDAQPTPGGAALPVGARLRFGTSGVAKGEGVIGAALSADGKLLAVATRDEIILRERAGGKQLARIAVQVAVSLGLSPDGKWLAFGNRQNLVLAEATSGNQVHTLEVPDGELAAPRGLSFSANGKMVAVGEQIAKTSMKPHAHVWDTATGKHLGSFAVAQNIDCKTALAPDGKRLATWGRHAARMIGEDDEAGQVVQLWDIATGKVRHAIKIDRPRAQVHAVAFAPDGKTIAVACGMSFFHVFDANSGRELRRFAGRNGLTTVLQFSADGKLLMAGSRTGTVQAWHTADGKRLTLSPGPRCQVAALASGGAGEVIAAGLTMQGVACWDARVGIAGQQTGHQATVLAVTFAADGQTVTSASADGSVLRWEAASGKLLKRIGVADYVMRLTTLALSPDGRYAATNSVHPNTVQLWDLGSGEPACDFEASKPSGTFGVAFSPLGDRLATAGLMKQVTIWDVETGQEAASLAYDKAGNLMSRGAPRIVFAPDGKAVAVALTTVDGMTGEPQGQVLLLDAVTGKERFGVSTPPGGNGVAVPPSVAFAVDGKVLALPGPNGSVALVHADSGKEWKRLQRPSGFTEITALAFSPDGRTLAFAHSGQRVLGPMGETGTTAALVEVWELASGQRRVAFQGQQGAINCLAFAPDGLTLASGSADTTVMLWDVGGTYAQKTVATLEAEWATLAKPDAAAAFVAQARLRASPVATVALLTRLLRPVKTAAVDPKQLAASVANLDSEDFTARAQAFQALEKLGAVAEAALRKGRAGKISLEMRRRIDDLLDKIARGNLTAEELQAVRAVEVLERIRTAPARALLGALANGEESAVLTREARRTLKRQ